MKNIFLSIGSNQGEKQSNIDFALCLIEENIGKVIAKSKVYKTESWGFDSKDEFFNMAIEVFSNKKPEEIINEIKFIEKKLYRKKNNSEYADRTIDIDILFYGNNIITKQDLCIPHPLFHFRKFCTQPLNDIASNFMHPVLKKTIKEIYNQSE